MQFESVAYFVFGISLVVIFGAIIVHSYARKRKRAIEEPKYRMLRDDD